VRLAPGGNDEHLVGVGRDDLLPVAVAGTVAVVEYVGPGQDAAPWQDGFDDALVRSVLRDEHFVADGDHVGEAGLLGAERAAYPAYQAAFTQVHTAQAAAHLDHDALQKLVALWCRVYLVAFCLCLQICQCRGQHGLAAFLLPARHDALAVGDVLQLGQIVETLWHPILAAYVFRFAVALDLLTNPPHVFICVIVLPPFFFTTGHCDAPPC